MRAARILPLCLLVAGCGHGSRSDPERVLLPPEAVIESDFNGDLAPVSVQFDSRESFDQDGSIDRIEWQLSDGSISAEPTVTEIYSEPGQYTVELSVIDNDGQVGRASLTLEIDSARGAVAAVLLLLQSE